MSGAQRMPSIRIGAYYGLASVATLVGAGSALPWSILLLWPALVFSAVAAAYLGNVSALYGKRKGRIPAIARVALSPALIGQSVSLAWYRMRCRAWDMVVPGVWIGRQLTDSEAAAAVVGGVTSVLDLTAEFSEARPFLVLRYRNLPILDLTAPRIDQLHEAVGFIAGDNGAGTVYVHCKAGYSRSAAVVGAYLLWSGAAPTCADAVRLLQRARPSIVIRPEALAALESYARWLAQHAPQQGSISDDGILLAKTTCDAAQHLHEIGV